MVYVAASALEEKRLKRATPKIRQRQALSKVRICSNSITDLLMMTESKKVAKFIVFSHVFYDHVGIDFIETRTCP